MTIPKFNRMTPNNEVGIQFVKSRRVIVDTPFGEFATWIKAGTAGTIVSYNSSYDDYNIIQAEAGETIPILCDQIVTGATIDGAPETTTSTGMFWATTLQQLTDWTK
jgi:hypothetical protein